MNLAELNKRRDFLVGDNVKHFSGSVGVVVKIEKDKKLKPYVVKQEDGSIFYAHNSQLSKLK